MQTRNDKGQLLFLFSPATNLDVIFSKCSYDPGLLKISNVLIPAAIAKGLPRERERGEMNKILKHEYISYGEHVV